VGDQPMLRYADEGHFRPFEDDEKRKSLDEIARFCIVGCLAVAIQYAVYLLLVSRLSPTLSNTVAYIVSFVFNYLASTLFTFRTRFSVGRVAGFAFSHVINYALQTLFLNLFIRLGVGKELALLPMFAICVPINFLLVRHFLRK